MKVLVKQALIADIHSPYNGQRLDILIENGIVAQLAPQLPDTDTQEVIEAPQLAISPGWCDTWCQSGEPGYEQKETLATLAGAAQKGGYTCVALLPNTKPVIHNGSLVRSIRERSHQLPVNLHPLGAVTLNTEGRELAEMMDMHHHGAPAFTDGTNPIQNTGLLVKALQYLKAINAPLIQCPADRQLAPHGLMHESVYSVQLGLAGMPALAEELLVARDIELCRYAQSRLHITGISTARSLQLVLDAQKQGLDVTCAVTPYHLHFCDEDLQQYDTNLKVNPPLRSRADRDALREALVAGHINIVASHHQPHENDGKDCEFEYAAFGMETLETVFSALASIPGMNEQRIAGLLAHNPRKLLQLPSAVIETGAPAEITLFTLQGETVYTEKDLRSSARNNAFLQKNLRGRVVAVFNNRHYANYNN
jgi:dihydroorotase